MYKALLNMNTIVLVVLTVAYFYQILYTVVGFLFRKPAPVPEPAKQHRFAALISARNESAVIGELVASLKKQKYPSDKLDIYVLADNCTDDTAAKAGAAGAIVYERFNTQEVGKGYALDYLLKRLKAAHRSNPYDAYFVFDADNIVDPNFVSEMNKTFDQGFDAITCYRNSKNFAANWISAGYSIWFLREARFLNHPRMLLGSGCAISGTGFLVSDRIIEDNGGWPFHLMTEDIQFSAACACAGRRIGYCDTAMVYDEQPTSFKQSWKQRLRWSKGFYQVDAHYMLPLIKGIVGNKNGERMTCYDIFMTVAPCTLLTLFVLLFNCAVFFGAITLPHYQMHFFMSKALSYLVFALIDFYLGMFVYGTLTVVSEWKRIEVSAWNKIKYIWLFPVFMLTYVPISIEALFGNVQWSQIEHHSAAELAMGDHKS